jgi:hypothetical protein
MITPKLPSFFKTSSHRSFNFKTRYYDEKKDGLKNKKNEKVKIQFDKNWEPSKRSKINSKSNKTIFIIIVILLILSFMLLK